MCGAELGAFELEALEGYVERIHRDQSEPKIEFPHKLWRHAFGAEDRFVPNPVVRDWLNIDQATDVCLFPDRVGRYVGHKSGIKERWPSCGHIRTAPVSGSEGIDDVAPPLSFVERELMDRRFNTTQGRLCVVADPKDLLMVRALDDG
ncbi:MAG: hypothetical protein ACJAYU_002228 [Bradymonadia bacterium]